MKTKILVSILLVISIISAGLLAAKPDNPGKGKKPDKERPVPATDVEVVKKITLRGRPPWAGGGGKPKKKEGAATGILGVPVSGSRYALVVGISDYPGDDDDLNFSDDDASEMAYALTNVYGFNNVALLTDMGATRSAILSEIENIPTDAGEVVFFFSGHGANGIAEDGDKERLDEAIVVHDGVELVPIWDGELQAAFSGFDTSRIILIFDTCLAGGMERDLGESGRVIAMATTERGYAYESDDWENGEFSYYFVDRGIIFGEAHVPEHNYNEVTVEEAFDYAKGNCAYDRPTIGDEFENDLLP
jgi:hypothetical protein